LLLGCRTEDVVAVAVRAGNGQGTEDPASASAGSAGETDAVDGACNSNEDCASGSCIESRCATTLSVYYTTPVRAASALMARPVFDIHNDGTSAVPLNELEIRYFFTNEVSTLQSQCPILQANCNIVQLSFGQVEPARPLADTYLSVTFSAAAPSLAPGSSSGLYEVIVRNEGIGLLEQSNDYSFDASFVDAAPSEKSCLYRNGKLIWGREPPP
jgi:hypothetical protein